MNLQIFSHPRLESSVPRRFSTHAIFILATFMSCAGAVAGPLEDLQPGFWYEVPGSALAGVNPCPTNNCSYTGIEGQTAVMDDWNGGALATRYGTKGGLVVFGGGHRGYLGNEVYVFDVALLRWVRVTNPVDNPTCDLAEGELQDGSPCSAHTYDYMSYHPPTNSFVELTSASNHNQGGGGSGRVHLLNLDTKVWRRGAVKPTFRTSTGASSAYDPNRDVFWLLSAYNVDLAKYDPNANGGAGQWTEYQNFNIEIDATAAIDPVHDLYVAVEGNYNHAVYVFDLKNPSTAGVRVTTAGDQTMQNSGATGFEWDTVSQAFVGWAGGPNVYKLTPPSGDWRTGTWQWTRVPPASGNTVIPGNPNSHGTYSRFQYVPSINGFVVVNTTNQNVFFYKMNNAPPVVDPSITFTADATSLASGGGTTLRWTVTNANACTASNGWTGSKAISGTQAIGPLTAASTTYTLTCTNTGGGFASASLGVNVVANPPPTITLTANPTSVSAGGSSSLTWSTSGALACTASAGDASWTGTKALSGGPVTVGPIQAATTYTLSCTGAGAPNSASVTVSLGTASSTPTITLTASPMNINAGQTADLTWNASNATSCTASGSWSGSRPVSATERTSVLSTSQRYILTCSNATNTSSQEVVVQVGNTPVPPPPTGAALAPAGNSGGGAFGFSYILGLLLMLVWKFAKNIGAMMSRISRRAPAIARVLVLLGIGIAPQVRAGDVAPVVVANTTASAQTNVPVTFGQVFKPGDVPSGSVITATVTGVGTSVPIQVDNKATHADGSLRHAIVTLKLPSLAASGTSSVMLTSGPASGGGGSAVTLAQLLATTFDAQVSMTVAGTAYTASARTLLAGASQAWLTGPLVSEWIVGGPVKTAGGIPHAHLTAYFHVRAYSNGSGGVGQVRVDCAVENGWTLVTAPSSLDYTPSISVGGSNVYTGPAITHYYNTRWHKQFWWPSAPPAYVKLDTTYLRATKAVPNYGTMSVSDSFLNSILQTATPMDKGDLTGYMAQTGAQPPIGPLPRWDAEYMVSNGDVRAMRNALANHDSAGSYPTHYRDEVTGRPVSINDRPSLSLQVRRDFPAGTGTSSPYIPDTAHQPSLGFFAYLITGDYYYLEEMQFWNSWNQLWMNADYRQGNKGILNSEIRARAWMMRSLAQAAYLTPDGHPYKAHLIASVNYNAVAWNAEYTNNPNANALGAIQYYIDNTKFSMWEDDFLTFALAYAVDLGFTSVQPFRDWKMKFVVGRNGINLASEYCYLHAAIYRIKVGPSEDTFYPDFKTFHDENVNAGTYDALTSCTSPATATAGYPGDPDGYVANMLPALAAAVEAGYPGAAAAWARQKAATPQPNFNPTTGDYPNWNVVPRNSPASTSPSVSLSASLTSIAAGGGTTLSWNSVNATSCTASGGWSGAKSLTGSETISNIMTTTGFTITCVGATAPTAQQTVQVQVGSGSTGPTVTLTPSATSVASGGSVTLTWSSTNATSCTASGGWSGSRATSGTQVVNNLTASTSFTLTCNGTGSTTGTQTANVAVTGAGSSPGSGSGSGSAPASDSGGGGALDVYFLMLLIAAAAVRLAYAQRWNVVRVKRKMQKRRDVR